MHSKFRRPLLGFAAVGLALGLTACAAGSAPSGGTHSAATSAASGATKTSTPAAAGGGGTTLLQKVQSTRKLTVALAPFAPLEFQSKKTKQWEGFDISMLGAFAHSLGAHLSIQALPFAATIQAVSVHRADITANIFKTAKRAKIVAFSKPVLNYVDGVIVNAQHPQVTTDSVSALSGKRIGTCRGCAEQAFVPKIPHATNVSFSTAEESFLAVSTGRVAAAFQPVMYAQYDMHQNPSLHLKVLGAIPRSAAGAAQKPQGFYAVAKGTYSKTFLTKLNAFLAKSCKSGKTKSYLTHYALTGSSYLSGIC